MRTRVHVNIPVRDLEASIDFYRRFLGHEPTKRKDGYANFRLDAPALHLALMETEVDPVATTTHYGVELFESEDLAAWRERVETAGLSTRVEEDVTCCYARADKFWVADPEGREWEVWVRSDEAETMGTPEIQSDCCVGSSCAPAPVSIAPPSVTTIASPVLRARRGDETTPSTTEPGTGCCP